MRSGNSGSDTDPTRRGGRGVSFPSSPFYPLPLDATMNLHSRYSDREASATDERSDAREKIRVRGLPGTRKNRRFLNGYLTDPEESGWTSASPVELDQEWEIIDHNQWEPTFALASESFKEGKDEIDFTKQKRRKQKNNPYVSKNPAGALYRQLNKTVQPYICYTY